MKFAAFCVTMAALAVGVGVLADSAAKQDKNVYMRALDGPLPGYEEFRHPELSSAPGKVRNILDNFE